MPRVTITHDLCMRIETQADDEQIPVSKLIEKLLLDAIREKTMYCSRLPSDSELHMQKEP